MKINSFFSPRISPVDVESIFAVYNTKEEHINQIIIFFAVKKETFFFFAAIYRRIFLLLFKRKFEDVVRKNVEKMKIFFVFTDYV